MNIILYFCLGFLSYLGLQAILKLLLGLCKGKEKQSSYDHPKVDVLQQIKQHYDLSVKRSDEVPIKIHELWLYPVRGVQGILVNQVELTDGGFRYDREWVIIRESKLKPLASSNSVTTMFLRAQVFNTDKADYS